LQAARALSDGGFFDSAASRAYYASPPKNPNRNFHDWHPPCYNIQKNYLVP
jgi:hypothetical protein